MAFPENVLSSFHEKFQKLPGEKKRLIALVCTAVFVFFLVLSVILSLRNSGQDRENSSGNESSERQGASGSRQSTRIVVPADEVFLPDEPDFLSGIMIERERREVWTDEDAAEHWQDPLKFGEEPWRDRIEAVIDVLLERIP